MGITDKQIKAWKDLHKDILVIETEDEKVCYLKDPINDLTIAKAVIAAFNKSDYDLVESMLANCWLGGDEELKDEAYKNELASHIRELLDIPNCEVKKSDGGYEMTCEGATIRTRLAMRADITKAEKRNPEGIPFLTSEYLLKNVIDDKEALEHVKANNVRAFIGFCAATDKIKNKKKVFIKKL